MDTHMEDNKHYHSLAIMIVLSFISMYVFMYAMVNIFSNVYSSFNQFYMAGLMTAPMVIIEMCTMRAMYHNKKWNAVIIVISTLVFIVFWIFIRQQTAVGDKQFLRSMIPHHAGAILMCEQAKVKDPEIIELCKGIIINQQSEINQMKSKLKELEQ